MIVLYNPHTDDFLAEPPHFRFLKRRPLRKYGYLLKGAIARGEMIEVYVDGTISAFIPERWLALLPAVVRRVTAGWEIQRWVKINGLEGKVRVIDRVDNVRARAALMFSYKGATGPLFERRQEHLRAFASIVSHLSHYFISTDEKARNLARLDNLILAGDSDVRNNPYFQHYFPWYKRPLLLSSFAVSARFQDRTPFAERQAKAVATGTFHNLREERPQRKYRDFMQFFRTSAYHPVRKLLHENREQISAHVDCYIAPYREGTPKSAFHRLARHFAIAQKAYFQVDIAALYNTYRYAIVGEEATGFPALGAFEAMACGCLLLADPQFYQGLGIVPGTHFIQHHGTLQSIIAAIDELNADPVRAARIAANGKAFVQQHLQEDQAYTRFVAEVAQLISTGADRDHGAALPARRRL